jgi:SAM-dependent methyltransferase
MLKRIFNLYSNNARKKRSEFFMSIFNPDENTRILDLGGGDGELISKTVPYKKNVFVADISSEGLKQAQGKGYKVIPLDESGKIPCREKEFDVIFCNSVLEHVTVDKHKLYSIKEDKEFHELAFERQKLFADEIRTKCEKYYVQTPYKYFLIESHTWLPGLFVLFPRKLQISIISFFNKFWPKKSKPDFNLLTVKEMKLLFPEATIYKEKSMFFIKSLMAVKN